MSNESLKPRDLLLPAALLLFGLYVVGYFKTSTVGNAPPQLGSVPTRFFDSRIECVVYWPMVRIEGKLRGGDFGCAYDPN